MRDVKSAIMWSCKVGAESKYITESKKATKLFDTIYKSMKEEMSPEEVRTKLGNPAVFILNAMAHV
eukprot:7637872-Karenia_brevis.AAC.1